MSREDTIKGWGGPVWRRRHWYLRLGAPPPVFRRRVGRAGSSSTWTRRPIAVAMLTSASS